MFMGTFENYANVVEEYPLLKVNSVFLGFVRDVLSVRTNYAMFILTPKKGMEEELL